MKCTHLGVKCHCLLGRRSAARREEFALSALRVDVYLTRKYAVMLYVRGQSMRVRNLHHNFPSLCAAVNNREAGDRTHEVVVPLYLYPNRPWEDDVLVYMGAQGTPVASSEDERARTHTQIHNCCVISMIAPMGVGGKKVTRSGLLSSLPPPLRLTADSENGLHRRHVWGASRGRRRRGQRLGHWTCRAACWTGHRRPSCGDGRHRRTLKIHRFA